MDSTVLCPWPYVLYGIVSPFIQYDTMLVGQMLFKSSDSGAYWGSVGEKGNPILGIFVNSGQNELLHLPGWKESNAVDFPPSDWLLSLRDSVLLGF